MNKQYFLIFVLALLFVPIINAESLGTFKVGEEMQINNYCSTADCTYANLTNIKLPNATILYINELMTKTGNDYNYSYTPPIIGLYSFNTCSNPSGVLVCEEDSFEVTPNGYKQSVSQGIGSFVYLVLMVILMFVFGFIGTKLLKNDHFWVIGLFSLFLSILFLVYNTWLGYEYHRLFTGLPDSSIPETIFYIFMTLIVLGFLVSVALLILNWKKIFKYIKREIKRKETEDKDVEDWDIDAWGGKDYGR